MISTLCYCSVFVTVRMSLLSSSSSTTLSFFCFFFQAEDGIRDHCVTGVQTCALPISRDYALMLVMLRLSLRVSEVCSLRASSVKWSHGRWTLRCKVKGGREEVWPLPKERSEERRVGKECRCRWSPEQ